jgi:hypothetical protein
MIADHIGSFLLQDFLHSRIANIHLVETRASIHILSRAMRQVINYQHIMTRVEVRPGQVRANKAGTTHNCYFHEQLYPYALSLKIPGAHLMRS